MNTGYAMNNLLSSFIQMAFRLVDDKKNIHISFTELEAEIASDDLMNIKNILQFSPQLNCSDQKKTMAAYIEKHGIDVVFAFDQPVEQTFYQYFRRAGVKRIISYWGAPISGINKGLKLFLKRIEVWLHFNQPDHYIFESTAMAESAYQGRGIAKKNVSVAYLGVDTDRYKPAVNETYYAHDVFCIPRNQKIIYYSGHMEPRKGVAVLIRAAIYLFDVMKRRDFHFLIIGNKAGEETIYQEMLSGYKDVVNHVTFGGYRNDVCNIIPSCSIGAIASTGWDSFTVSSLEIASCGLPLIVSELQGLKETVENEKTGYTFEPGNYHALSNFIALLLDNEQLRFELGQSGRQRVCERFSQQTHIDRLVEIIEKVV